MSRRQAAYTISSAHQNFWNLFRATPHLITITDLGEGRFLECNPAFCQTTKFSRAEVIGLTAFDLPLWDEPALRRQIMEQLPVQGGISGLELKFWTKTRDELWGRCSFSPVNYDGRMALLATIEDITAERLLRRSDALKSSILDYLFENSEDPIYAKDREGRYLVCNPALARSIGGYTVEEVEGRLQKDLLSPADLAAVLESDARILATGEPEESELVLRQGRRKTVMLARKGPWRDDAGAITGVVGISRDITARKSLEEELKKQNDLKDRLFTILAHDLRGPIGSTAQLIGLVSEQVKDQPDLALAFDLLHKSTSQTFNLLENLLAWVQSRMVPSEASPEPFSVLASLFMVRDWLLPQALHKNLSLEVEAPEHLTLTADEKTIQTILRNLVSNAIKYTPSGGRVVLRAQRVRDEVQFEVADTGVGLSAAKIAGLFGPGKVASAKGTSGEAGHGLGLMFSADLARGLGGRLSVESVEGQGSVFRLVV